MAVTSQRLPRPLQLAIVDAARRRQRPVASSSLCVTLDDLRCSICFDTLCFPVTLPCGHNFDRGCILTAWAHDANGRPGLRSPLRAASSDEEDADTGVEMMQELQVNLLLKDLIASLYPAETRGAATPAKQKCPHLTLPSSPRELTTNTAASAFRRRPNLRTFSSFLYVCAASITDPPGFVLAVLLLLVLLATACSPQPATAPPAASAMVMFDTMDRMCNGLSLLIHRISMQMDQVDQMSPWIRLLSYLL